MEFAASALMSMAAGGGEAALAAGSAIPGAIGATSVGGGALVAGGGSLISAGSAASILSGGSTVLSILNAGRVADAKAQALNSQADDADTQGTIEQINGVTRRASMKQGLVQALGQRDVATAAGGSDLSFGTPAVSRQQTVDETDRQLSIDSDTSNAQVARLRERAALLRKSAVQTQSGGLGTQAALALQGAANFVKRG